MKLKFSLFFVMLNLCHLATVFSQFLVVNAEPGNCTSCIKGMSYLNKNDYPIYMVFQESETEYKQQIEDQYRLKNYGVKIIFNTSLYKSTRVKNSYMPRLILFDKYKNQVFNVAFTEVDSHFVSEKITKYFNKIKERQNSSSDIPTYDGNSKYVFNYSYGTLKSYENEMLNSTFSSSKLTLNDKIKNLDSIDKADMTNTYNLISYEHGQEPKFSWFYINKETKKKYLRYDQFWIRDVDTSSLFGIYYLLILDEKDSVNMYKINTPENYLLYNGDCFVLNDSTFYFILYNDSLENLISKNILVKMPFVAQYSLIDNQLKFDRFIDIDLPYINKIKLKHNFLSFNVWQYPFTSQPFSNEIIDIQKNNSVKILNDSLYNTIITSKPFGYFNNKKIGYDKSKNEIVLIYSLDEIIYVNRYSKDLNLISNSQLKFDFEISNGYLFDDKYGVVYVKLNDNHEYLSLPIEAF